MKFIEKIITESGKAFQSKVLNAFNHPQTKPRFWRGFFVGGASELRTLASGREVMADVLPRAKPDRSGG